MNTPSNDAPGSNSTQAILKRQEFDLFPLSNNAIYEYAIDGSFAVRIAKPDKERVVYI